MRKEQEVLSLFFWFFLEFFGIFLGFEILPLI